MESIKQLLQDKGSEIWKVTQETTVFDALELMAEKNIGALLVFESDKLIGIFSERDYARKVILKGKASKNTLIKEIMSTKVLYIGPEQSIEECMALMTDKRVRHLPVLVGDEVLGVISIGDVVKAIISEQKITIQWLEKYIGGV